MLKDKIKIPKYTLSEEIVNAVTHGIGASLSIAALILCIIFSKNTLSVVSSIVYGSTSIILYLMSTLYHSFKINNAKRIFRIIDHCSIFLLIAGTYTPYVLLVLPRSLGWSIFGIIWSCAIIGIILNSIDLGKYKKISMILYLIMGWMIIFSFDKLLSSMDIKGIYLMLSGGILYTLGAIFYALGKKKKYIHSLFHIFVLAASICFFFSIFLYVI